MVDKLHGKRVMNMRGFTLIEMLLVLFILLLTSSIVFQITLTLSEKWVVNQFFQQLMLDIQEIQALAIKNDEAFYIQFNSSNNYKGHGIFSGEILFEREIPQGIKVDMTSNLKHFMVYPSGDVSNFGTIKFHTPFGQTNLIIYIKEGRMRLVEL
ncbi:prepilin-type N-terminal cleavage/methylation domain-containing protein [Ureibacillus chungkukjangi]|uniref:Prepilin-type N-terminal cleavage/methylation domain-containing protein n=3 Tax=Ureibacillus chungkukjangi TaxID=1202712 RepID=A0A318TI60_9BACL|nr:prepilin-type N-terminal cleavage/methylation domain-containing protein [Ureibacillus chungkukjangi]